MLSKAEQRLRAFSVEMVSAVGGPEREALVRLLDISTLATRVFGDAERAEVWLTRLVHMDRDPIPPAYQLLRIAVPDDIVVEIAGLELPLDWRTQMMVSREVGDR
ncbi:MULTISPECIES: hypothetical protein [unclassified Bradyrhizobium]|uniref:hypothetical protein n=1 Tax=unclassified Bradyrhizobium TaxID=2631580 RepID=UPI001FFB4579|nr:MULTISPECIES: hypothetical protein [unclassified Bradyrhizobium]MCK1709561.1 hypothetical protein [Bradyrhizobium sp. 143]MCK1731710.1 hypothetical protein [Bradyrhizobium sp. 142]